MLTIGLLSIIPAVKAQSADIDSLRKQISAATDPGERLLKLLALCAHKQSLSADSLERYVRMAKTLSAQNGTPLDRYTADFYYAGFLMNRGWLDSAVNILNAFLPRLGNTRQERQLYLRAEFLKTNTFVRKNEFREALREYYTIINEARSQNDTTSLAMGRNGIGWVHMELAQFQNALTWLFRALHTARDTSFYDKYSFVYSNIASSYNSLKIPDSAEYFVQKAIAGARRFNDLECLANSLNILADTYIISKREVAAGPLLRQVVEIRQKIGDPYYIVSDMMQLAVFYAHHNEADKGIATSQEGIALARKMGLQSKLPILYDALAENYRVKGDDKRYAETLKTLLALKDSVYGINSVDLMNEMRTRYDLQRNETTIVRQKLALVEKGYWINAYFLILLTAILVFLFLFREYGKKNKVRMRLILDKEKQIGHKAVLVAEDNQRKRISSDLHDSLGAQANAILYGTELLQQKHSDTTELVSDLHDTAKDMLITLRETLWAMKSADATAAEVWLRVINFSKQLARYYPMASISTLGAVPAGFHINAARSLNIVLILQEALNNSVRHSGAKNITLSSVETEAAWTILLEDDGKGFNPETAGQKRESYGLMNIKTRAESANIRLSIQTGENQGVKILLAIDHPA